MKKKYVTRTRFATLSDLRFELDCDETLEHVYKNNAVQFQCRYGERTKLNGCEQNAVGGRRIYMYERPDQRKNEKYET